MRRCHHDIINAILQEAVGGAKKTNIMYAAKVSYYQLERYIKLLNENGLIKETKDVWSTTEKGRRFIEAFQVFPKLTERRET